MNVRDAGVSTCGFRLIVIQRRDISRIGDTLFPDDRNRHRVDTEVVFDKPMIRPIRLSDDSAVQSFIHQPRAIVGTYIATDVEQDENIDWIAYPIDGFKPHLNFYG